MSGSPVAPSIPNATISLGLQAMKRLEHFSLKRLLKHNP
jgi:hypothetical protein